MENRKILNLAHLEKSDIKYKKTTFPDGEPHIQLLDFDTKHIINIETRICNPNDLYTLLLVCDILDRWGVAYDINVSYLMSARMDRLMDIMRPVSFNVVKNVVKTTHPKMFHVFDLHTGTSASTKAFRECIGRAYKTRLENNSVYVFPDMSASTRYPLLLDSITSEFVVVCEKRRVNDTVTTVISEEDIVKIKESGSVMIVDDIIDGGRTISNVIDIIKENAPKTSIYIYASHCVNKEGLIKILNKCDVLYTSNSYADWDKELPEYKSKLKVFEII